MYIGIEYRLRKIVVGRSYIGIICILADAAEKVTARQYTVVHIVLGYRVYTSLFLSLCAMGYMKQKDKTET